MECAQNVKQIVYDNTNYTLLGYIKICYRHFFIFQYLFISYFRLFVNIDNIFVPLNSISINQY